MPEIRSFRNGDLPRLLEVFHEHHLSAGQSPRVSAAQFEQAVLSRTSFRPEQLLVLVDDVAVQGWCHSFLIQSPPAAAEGRIAACCFRDGCDQEDIKQVLSQACQQLASSGATQVMAGLAHDESYGYMGLEPYGPGFGVNRMDLRISGVLASLKFDPHREWKMLTAATQAYRPPVSRESLQWRRSTSVQTEAIIPEARIRASSLSHLDVLRHHLIDRSGTEIGQVDFWFSDAEAEVMSPGTLIIDPPTLDHNGMMSPAEAYLIASVLSNVGSQGIERAEISVDSANTGLVEQLQKLCFTTSGEGVQWRRST